jgi:HEAT repeat protein
VRDLARVGIAIATPWDLVNKREPHGAAIPVLLDWLDRVDSEVAPRERATFREALVRSLTVKEARGIAGPALLHEFRRDDVESSYRWVVANALAVVADESIRDDLIELATDARYGKDRQMLVLALARTPDPKVVRTLLCLLKDDDVAGHAAKALGRVRPTNVRHAVERLLAHPTPWVRTEARKTLAKLPD